VLRRATGAVAAGLSGAACGVEPTSAPNAAEVDIPVNEVAFDALGDSFQLPVEATGDDGVPLDGSWITWQSRDPAIAVVAAGGVVIATGNGRTHVLATASGGVRDSVAIVVDQAADSVEVGLLDPSLILLGGTGVTLPVFCRGYDRNGNPFAPRAGSLHGTLQGTRCDDQIAVRSGWDTLKVRSGEVERLIPFIVAVAPSVSSPAGNRLPADSTPANLIPWAPTLVLSHQGELHLYFGHYLPDLTSPIQKRGHLGRYVSTDGGASFRYDGIVLRRDSLPCSPRGDGIENIAIVPRADGPGWRMFYAAGGFTCYGWQVFSAVSTDQDSWQPEPGVRVGNGGSLPPNPPIAQKWPTGEGMTVDRLPTGEWRMIMGSYEPVVPRVDKFQITEWRSADQIDWSYHRTLLTTDDVGSDAQRSIYSPTIREIVPGLHRMIFTGDNRNQPGGRSRLYSAVSVDLIRWQVEGVLMSSPVSDLFYSSLVGDLLVFIRFDPGIGHYIATARVTMP
jgi:hypothetical protein